MNSFLQYLNLDGYGMYVWPAYGLAAVFLALHFFLPWNRWRKLNKKNKGAHAQTQ